MYKISGRSIKKTEKEAVFSIEQRLKKINKPTVFVGEAALRHKSLIKKKLGGLASFAPLSLNYIRASDIAFMSRDKMKKAGKFSALTLKAEYLRPGVDAVAKKRK